MSTNHVYVFENDSRVSTCGWRSVVPVWNQARAAARRRRAAFHAPGTKGEPGVIRVTLPYIRTEIPLFVVFRALGFVADKDILEHIVYDFGDDEMMGLLRPSIEEAMVIQSQAVALDFIGKRGSAVGVTREKRTAQEEILQKEPLPTSAWTRTARRAKRILGYITHRLLCQLKRRNEMTATTWNKRMDPAGPPSDAVPAAVPGTHQGRAPVLPALRRTGKDIQLTPRSRRRPSRPGSSTRRTAMGAQGAQDIRGRLAGAEPAVALAHAVAPAAAQLAHRAEEAASRAAAQLALGWRPRGDPRGAGGGSVKNPVAHGPVSGLALRALLEFLEEWTMENLRRSAEGHPQVDEDFVNGLGAHRDLANP